MKGFDLDLRRLRPTLITFGVAVLFAGALFTASHLYREAHEDAFTALQQRLQALQEGYRQAVRDRRTILAHYPRFKQLKAQGFLGAEARLLWVEEVRETALTARVIAAHYRLHESAPRPVEANYDTGGYGLYGHPMRLRLDLAHEGDFLAFLDLLEARGLGVWELQRCRLSRLTPHGEPSLDGGANVQADCRMLWFNLQGITGAGEGEAQT